MDPCPLASERASNPNVGPKGLSPFASWGGGLIIIRGRARKGPKPFHPALIDHGDCGETGQTRRTVTPLGPKPVGVRFPSVTLVRSFRWQPCIWPPPQTYRPKRHRARGDRLEEIGIEAPVNVRMVKELRLRPVGERREYHL